MTALTLLFVALALGCSDAPADHDDVGSASDAVDEYCVDEPCVLFTINDNALLGGVHFVDLAEPDSSTRYDNTARYGAARTSAIRLTSALDAIVVLRDVGGGSHTLYRIELDEPGSEVAIATDFPRGDLFRVPDSEYMLGRLTTTNGRVFNIYSFVPDQSLALERLHPLLEPNDGVTEELRDLESLQRHEVSADGQTVVVGLHAIPEGTMRLDFELWRSPVDASSPPEKLDVDEGQYGDPQIWSISDHANARVGLIRTTEDQRRLEIGALDDWPNLQEVVATGVTDGQLAGFDWAPNRDELLYLTADRQATYVNLVDIETHEPIVDKVEVVDGTADCKIFDLAPSKTICWASPAYGAGGTTVMIERDAPTSTVEILDRSLIIPTADYDKPSFAEFGPRGRYLYFRTFRWDNGALERVDTEPPHEVNEVLPTGDQSGDLTSVGFSDGRDWIVYTLQDTDDITHLYAVRFDALDAPIRLGSGTPEHPDITWSIAGGE